MMVVFIKFKETVVKFIFVSLYLSVYTIDVPNGEILVEGPAERSIDHVPKETDLLTKRLMQASQSVSCLVDLASLVGGL